MEENVPERFSLIRKQHDTKLYLKVEEQMVSIHFRESEGAKDTEKKGETVHQHPSALFLATTLNLSKTAGRLPIYFIWTANRKKSFQTDPISSNMRNTKC